MKKTQAVNTFTDGLVMDINPLLASNKGLCNALNATIITMNGNENVLQNDMGNGRVETARLPEGYVPIGTTEYGGIIYIVSYNPILNRCQIGSFPSPERNITSQELNNNLNPSLDSLNFLEQDSENTSDYIIKNNIIKTKLSDNILHPGDKFIVVGEGIKSSSEKITGIGEFPKNIKLKLATIDNNGRIIYLNNLIKYNINGHLFEIGSNDNNNLNNLSDYQKKVDSAYNVFTSKIAGQLYVISNLELIDGLQIGWNIINKSDQTIKVNFNIYTQSSTEINISGIKLITTIGKNKTSEYYERDSYESNILSFIKELDLTNISNEIKFTIIPFMNYGLIKNLSTDIFINIKKLNESGKISNSIWQYKKNNDELLLKCNLNSNFVEGEIFKKGNLYFIPYEKIMSFNYEKNSIEDLLSKCIKEEIKLENVTINKTFTLNNSEIINSATLKSNTLYVCNFQITTNLSTYNLYKCLYTTGLFNEFKEDDFDQILIPLKYQIFNNASFNEKSRLEKELHNPKLISNSNFKLAKNCSETTINGAVDLNLSIKLIDNQFGFAITDSSNVKYNNILINNIKLQSNYILENTGIEDSNVDPQYVIPVQQIDENQIVINNIIENNELKGDWVKASIEYYKQQINITGQFYNKIAATIAMKGIPVSNYYSPIIKTMDDYKKYGIQMNQNNFSFLSNNFYGLGLSNTNRTGTEYSNEYTRALCETTLNYDLSSQTYSNTINNLIEDPSGVGNGNSDFFSNFHELSHELNYYNKAFQIFPLVMMSIGESKIKLISPFDPRKQYDYSFGCGDRTGHFDNKKSKLYEQAKTNYRVVQLLIKMKDDLNHNFLGLGGFYKITGPNYNTIMKVNNENYNEEFETTIPNLIGSLVSGCFYNDTSGHIVNLYVCDKLSYYDLTSHKIILNCSCDIDKNSKIDINFNEHSLNNICNSIEFFTKTQFSCLRCDYLKNTNNFKVEINLNTRNICKDEFENSSSNTQLNSYVDIENNFGDLNKNTDIKINPDEQGTFPSVLFLSKNLDKYELGINSHIFNIINNKLYLSESKRILINPQDYIYSDGLLYANSTANQIVDFSMLFVKDRLSGIGNSFSRSRLSFGNSNYNISL